MNFSALHALVVAFWHDALAALRHTLATNELAQGGLVIGTLGALAAFLRTLPARLWDGLHNRLTVTLDIQGDDAAFPWLAAWLAAQPVGRRLRHLGVVTRFSEQMGGQNLSLGTDQDGDEVQVRLVPLSGGVLLRYHGHWLLVRPARERRQTESRRLLGYTHSLTFTMLSPARAVIPELLREAYALTAGFRDGQIELYVPQNQDWNLAERRPARPLQSLLYDHTLQADLHQDLTAFLADRDWYASLGIPYRRGYLLYGPPGNGKSSLVAALAGEFGLGVCVLNLAAPEMSDTGLITLLGNLPRRAVLLLEDIDAVFRGREPRSAGIRLSFNGLLNALDGVAAGENGRLTFMTTNHMTDLDPALIRPGRADRRVFLDNASRAQVKGMLRRFWPTAEQSVLDVLASQIPERRVSMAQVQEYLLIRRGDFAAVVRDWAEMMGQVGESAPDCPGADSLIPQEA